MPDNLRGYLKRQAASALQKIDKTGQQLSEIKGLLDEEIQRCKNECPDYIPDYSEIFRYIEGTQNVLLIAYESLQGLKKCL